MIAIVSDFAILLIVLHNEKADRVTLRLQRGYVRVASKCADMSFLVIVRVLYVHTRNAHL